MAPPIATEIFGDRLELARRYVAHLADTGVSHGLIGPREAPRLWDRHMLNCAVVTELIPQGALVADIGSGAGLPGLVIAIRRPDVHVVLIEPLLRRVTWLHRVVEELGLTNVDIERGRAEQLWDTVGPVDVVTSRAVSALANLATWSAPLLKPGGVMLPMKGAAAAAEVADSASVLEAVGVTEVTVEECGAQWLDEPTTVVKLTVGEPRRLSSGSPSAGSRSKKAKRAARKSARAGGTAATPSAADQRGGMRGQTGRGPRDGRSARDGDTGGRRSTADRRDDRGQDEFEKGS